MKEKDPKNSTNKNLDLLSTTQAADLLKISRVYVFKKIKAGEIKAEKVGRNYVIRKSVIMELLHPSTSLTDEKKDRIHKAVERTVKEYGETLKLLGKE